MLVCAATASAAAQNPAGVVACRNQRIDSISVDAQAPTVTGLSRVPVVGKVVRETHVITRLDVVRGYLLLKPGDRCNALRVSESERILRAQPFIADANIDVVANNRGGVDLIVKDASKRARPKDAPYPAGLRRAAAEATPAEPPAADAAPQA